MDFLKFGLLLAQLLVISNAKSLSFQYSGGQVAPMAASGSVHWGYDGSVGPEYWPGMYETCGTSHQSPVDVKKSSTVDRAFNKLELTNFGNDIEDFVIFNNGHTAQVSLVTDTIPQISGGPLSATYQLAQYHFHWGDDDTVGSENKVDGQSYPMDMHMVFWNTNYGTYTDAITHSDGLTVMSFFFKIANKHNSAFAFVDKLEDIVQAETQTDYWSPPNLLQLLPSDLSEYYTFDGSLTTPPCSEIVTWIIMRETIKISSSQLEKFRSLKDDEGHEIHHNHRPTQPLNDRIVYKSV